MSRLATLRRSISCLPARQLDPSLQGLLTSLNTVFTAGYFVTKDMRVQLRNHRFGGTLPILLVFLARSGCTVLEVKRLTEGAQIDFLADGSRRSLFYFTVDLSDAGQLPMLEILYQSMLMEF